MKYTITADDEAGATAEAYIEAKYPLAGNEPVIKERFQALAGLVENTDKEYFDAFKSVLAKKMGEQ